MTVSVKFDPIVEDRQKKELRLKLPCPLLRAMKEKSKLLPGCKRRHIGSESHFARVAILVFMRDYFGVDFEKINKNAYKIPIDRTYDKTYA